MPHVAPRIPLALLSGLLAAAPAFTQTTTSPVANVYLQSHKGVYVFNASASGRLTLVQGSLFADTGQMTAIRGSFLISAGTNELHSYKIEANGAVGSQVAQINTQNYSGSQCGSNTGGLLDHSGEFYATALFPTSTSTGCASLQTYKVGTNGQFTFVGDAVSTDGDHNGPYEVGVSTYSSNDQFAYGVQFQDYGGVFLAYRRDTAGDLVTNGSFSEKDPAYNPSDYNYAPWLVAADNASHLAVVMNEPFGPNCCSYFQLASYTINDQTGAIQSTNTYANMPVLKVYPNDMAMSWSGSLVAVAGGPGLQLFHFNGAAPATTFGGVLLPKVHIDRVAFDKSNHLYAVSYASAQLHVFTISGSTVSEAPGSPYSVPWTYGEMFVVPK